MLHDEVVPVGVYADIGVVGEAPVHNQPEHPVDLRTTADPVDDVVGLAAFRPLPLIDLRIRRLRRRHEREISYQGPLVLRS